MRSLIFLFLLVAVPAGAEGRHAVGALSLEAPVTTPDRPQDDSPMVLGKLTFKRLIGPASLFAGGQIQTRSGFPFNKENKWQLGIELPSKRALTPYFFAEDRFSLGLFRYVAGIRYGFDLKY